MCACKGYRNTRNKQLVLTKIINNSNNNNNKQWNG